MINHIISLRMPCPICNHAPLIFVSCNSCDSTFAWCSEEDHPVGIYDGNDLRELGLGDTPGWAREGCPACKVDSLIYSTRQQVNLLGFPEAKIHSDATLAP